MWGLIESAAQRVPFVCRIREREEPLHTCAIISARVFYQLGVL